MRKPRWALTRAQRLREPDRYTARFILGVDVAPYYEWTAAASLMWAAEPTQPTVTRVSRPVPRRRTWRHR